MWPVKAVSIPAYSVTVTARLLCPCFEFPSPSMCQKPTGVLCSRSIVNALHKLGQQGIVGRWMLLISSVYRLAPFSTRLHFKNISSKIELLRVLRQGQWSIKLSVGLPCKACLKAHEASPDYYFYLTLLWKFLMRR